MADEQGIGGHEEAGSATAAPDGATRARRRRSLRRSTWLRLATCLAAVAAPLGVTATPASAHEAWMRVHGSISITRSCCYGYYVTVTGHVHMSQADAQRFIDTPGHEISIRLMGEDGMVNGDTDDVLTGWYNPYSDWHYQDYWVSPDGLNFTRTRLTYGSELDEDWGNDEVYARIGFYDFREPGAYKYSQDATNVVSGSY